MKLATHIIAEKGKELIKTANQYINIELTVHKQVIGSIELYLNADTERIGDDYYESETDEWVLKWYDERNRTDLDPEIIAQGNIKPSK